MWLGVIEAKRALARVPDLGFGPPHKPRERKKRRSDKKKKRLIRTVRTIKSIKMRLRVDSID